jgi:outer membrane lipoprotein LolB
MKLLMKKFFMSSFSRALLVLSSLLLAACTSGIYREGGDEYGYWHLDGKLGIRSPQGADSVYMSWKQCDNRYQIRLNSLIGTHIASIDGNQAGVNAKFKDRPEIQANSAEALIENELGWTLPVGALQHWLRGETDSTNNQTVQRNSDGSLKKIIQDGWEVDYLRYHDTAEKNASAQTGNVSDSKKLPEKLRLKRDDSMLTLIISNWRLGVTPDHCLARN